MSADGMGKQRPKEKNRLKCARKACSKNFLPYRPWARFCSGRCRQAAFASRKVCVHCGKNPFGDGPGQEND